jgi:serine protease Do
MKSFITALCFLAASAAVCPVVAQTQPRAHSSTLRSAASRGYLGVGVVELTSDRVKALNLKDDRGVEVKRVDENSPAARAGLMENDVILEVNSKGIESIEQFTSSIGETAPGTKVTLTVWRNGGRKTIAATLDARPGNFFVFGGPDLPDAPMPPMPPVPFNGANPFPTMAGNSPIVGFEGEALNPQLAQFFGVKEGVLVRSVNAGTPAQRAGFKAGDVVIKVSGTPVTSPREITSLVRISRKKAINFTLVREKKEMAVNVEIPSIGERQAPAERQAL